MLRKFLKIRGSTQVSPAEFRAGSNFATITSRTATHRDHQLLRRNPALTCHPIDRATGKILNAGFAIRRRHGIPEAAFPAENRIRDFEPQLRHIQVARAQIQSQPGFAGLLLALSQRDRQFD